jgi:cyclophilin family peptidyl-prolyl cis-trans isomerase
MPGLKRKAAEKEDAILSRIGMDGARSANKEPEKKAKGSNKGAAVEGLEKKTKKSTKGEVTTKKSGAKEPVVKKGSEKKESVKTMKSQNDDGKRTKSEKDEANAKSGNPKKSDKSKAEGKQSGGEEGETGAKKKKAVSRIHCFFDVNIGKHPAGRVVIELFNDIAPITCENFRALCTGEKGAPLHYKGTPFHRIIPGFMAQGGDFENQDGSGGQSIYGRKFDDESFKYKHLKAGTVSMANSGVDNNRSQFFITTANKPLPFLDKKHVVFGHVTTGMEVIRAMEREGDEDGTPKRPVTIRACGRIKDKEVRRAKLAVGEAPPARSEEASEMLKCEKCGGGLKFNKRLKKKKLVRFWCKNATCGNMVSLPDTKATAI